MRRFQLLSVGSATLAMLMAAGVSADDAKKKKTGPDPNQKIIDAFVKAVKADGSIKADAKKSALAKVDKLRKDESSREYVITDALREVSTEFSKALSSLGAEKFAEAIKGLTPLVKSKNLWLAAEARYFIARASILEENYEAAMPHLDKLTGELADKTVRAGESLFLKGASQLHQLKRKEAGKSFSAFLKKYPHASERLRIAAWRQLEALQTIEKGSLADVHHHMEFSRRRLALKDSGKETRVVQKRIVTMLDKMIKELEKKGGG